MTDEEWQQAIAQLTAAKEEMENKKAEMEQQLAALNEQLSKLDPVEVVDKGWMPLTKDCRKSQGQKPACRGQAQLSAGIQKLQEQSPDRGRTVPDERSSDPA